MKNMRYYIPGVLMILAGILVLAVPQLLVVFAAASICTVGVMILYFGHQMKNARAGWGDLPHSMLYARVVRNPAEREAPYWF